MIQRLGGPHGENDYDQAERVLSDGQSLSDPKRTQSLRPRVCCSAPYSPAILTTCSNMTGLCPNRAAPPDFYAGPKWIPNDPLLFIHYDARIISATSFTTFPLYCHMVVQMVDKIWYDWQQKSIKSQYSYGGGSVTALPSYMNFTQFPTGLPPYLNVGFKRAYVIMISHPLLSPPSVRQRGLR